MDPKYISTYYKHRYLTSEITIANGIRFIPEEHWEFTARKSSKRCELFKNSARNFHWVLTPTKVTAHRKYLDHYIPGKNFISWGEELVRSINYLSSNNVPYFHPFLVSDLDFFFKYDSHWTPKGAFSYLEPFISALIEKPNSYSSLKYEEAICVGNCTDPSEKKTHAESYLAYTSKGLSTVFQVLNENLPDFSVRKSMNSEPILDERALIIHSSSYAFARGFVSSIFRETIEVFSPYVTASTIVIGEFDRILLFTAERNAAVAYDGGLFSDKIVLSLDQPYIKNIAHQLCTTKVNSSLAKNDIKFFNALGEDWLEGKK